MKTAHIVCACVSFICMVAGILLGKPTDVICFAGVSAVFNLILAGDER